MKRRSYKNPYKIRGFRSAERKGPELFNFGPFLTEKAAGIEAKSRLRQHYLSMGDATEKIKDVRKGRKLVGFRAPSASAWISPVRKNVGRRKNIGDGTYEGHPSFAHWAAAAAAANDYQLYTALSDCPRNQAYAIFTKLHPRLKGVGLVTKKLAEYAWDELHFEDRKNPRRNPRRNSGVKRIDVDANRWRDGSGNTYHVVSVDVNGKHEWTSPITYGYGAQYEQTAMDWLKKAGYAASSDRSLHRFCDDRGITCSSRAHDVKRKKDLGV